MATRRFDGIKRQALSWVLSDWMPGILVVVTVAVLRVTCPGCVDQSRANSNCEWTADRRFPIDVNNRAQWRHLVSDAQLAEEIAIRYGDAKFYRWAFPIRTETSGPIQTSDTHADNVRAQLACLARLNAAIENIHGVTSLQRTVASRQRNALFDSLVILSFLPVYAVGVRRVCERFGNVLRAEAPSVRLSANAIGSIVFSGVGLGLFRVWQPLMDGVRTGNPDGHGGFRAAAENYWSSPFVVSWLTAGAILFWFVAFASRRAEGLTSMRQ